MLRLSGSMLRHQSHGKFPSVSINNDGTIVEFYQPNILSSKILYRVGQLDGEEIKMSEAIRLDRGRYPKVAISNNNVVKVHEGRVNRQLYYHIGTIDANNKTVKWHSGVHSLKCWGRFPAVAVHGDRVVITYDRAYGSYKAYYCLGKFTAGRKNIKWDEKNRNIYSYGAAETSVAINEHNIVVAGRGWNDIICCVGRFQGNAIEFTTEIPFDHLGYCPTVCLDNEGYIVMIWQSFALRKLNYAIGKIPNHEEPTIEWPQHAPLRRYGYGYNPTIAISPDGTKVLEEHETNYAPHRCSLYYHTGTLQKPPPEPVQPLRNDQPAAEQGAVQPPGAQVNEPAVQQGAGAVQQPGARVNEPAVQQGAGAVQQPGARVNEPAVQQGAGAVQQPGARVNEPAVQQGAGAVQQPGAQINEPAVQQGAGAVQQPGAQVNDPEPAAQQEEVQAPQGQAVGEAEQPQQQGEEHNAFIDHEQRQGNNQMQQRDQEAIELGPRGHDQ